MTIAAPSPNPLEARINDLEARTEKLAARAGWTCAFGGDKACQVKVCTNYELKELTVASDERENIRGLT